MNVDVVIVTYNRLEKLKKALACYENQTMTFRNMIVVNNHSNDGTFEYLESWKNMEAPFTKHVINTEDNLGGSGGFYTGQKYAMSLNPDWIYLADDDAYAEPDMMEQFYKFCDTHDVDKMSAICGAVYGMDGKLSLLHRCTYQIVNGIIFSRKNSIEDDYKQEYFNIDLLSYVCSFLNVRALRVVGLVNPKYFIYSDDTEHSIRLKTYGDIVCVPKIRIEHEEGGGEPIKSDMEYSWRSFYICRNNVHMLKKLNLRVAIDRTMYVQRFFIAVAKDKEHKKLLRIALWNAWLGKLGKHRKYKPGWNPNIINNK